MSRLALPAVFLALCACQPIATDPRYIGPPERIDLSSCGGDPILDLVGQDISAMPATGGWGTLRVITPGMAVTEDYSLSRLNVEVDGAGRIIAVSCG